MLFDDAYQETETALAVLIAKLKKEYRGANKILQNRMTNYLKTFKDDDLEMRLKYQRGEITKKEYTSWRASKILIGKEWEKTRDSIAMDLINVDKIAAQIINGELPNIYALNMNFATYEIEHGIMASTSFQLYSRETVLRLLRDDPGILPHVSPSIPLEMRWNRQKITSVITRSVLSGESIPKIANSLQEVTGMNQSSAVRNARTYMTSAQNAGRLDAYERVKKKGVNVEKQWLATLDGRTRHTHRQLDGVHIPTDEKFDNGCRWPGDPDAPGAEIYNCRCRIVGFLLGIDEDNDLERNSKLGDMSYEEWKAGDTQKPKKR